MHAGIIHGQDEKHGGSDQATGRFDCKASSKVIPWTSVKKYLFQAILVKIYLNAMPKHFLQRRVREKINEIELSQLIIWGYR